MTRADHGGSGGEWPRWLEPLRPDEVTHERMKRRVRQQAEPLLHLRRDAAGWQSVAARWAVILAPVAAVLAVAFAGLAYRAGPPRPASAGTFGVSVEELVTADRDDAVPALLTSATEPSKEHLLAEVMAERVPQP